MRNFLYIIIGILGLVEVTYSSTRGDVKIIEATENIQYLSQKIATDYFFFYENSEDSRLKTQLYRNIDNLQFYIADITDITDKKEGINTKNILDFFTYSIEEFKQVPNKKINLVNAGSILDYSEELLEGARNIAKEHKYKFSKEEKMLMLSKEVQYLLERVMKYYIAFQIGLNSTTNHQEMKKAIDEIDRSLKHIGRYNYPEELKEKLEQINSIWGWNKNSFNKLDKSSIPHLLLDSTQYIEKLLTSIEQYHKKNL